MKRALCFPAQPKQPKMSLPKPVFFHKSAASFEYFPVKYLLTEVWCSGSSCPPVSKVKGRNAGQSAGAALWGECPKLTPCLPHPMAQGPSKGTNLDLFHQRAFRAGDKNSASQSQHIWANKARLQCISAETRVTLSDASRTRRAQLQPDPSSGVAGFGSRQHAHVSGSSSETRRCLFLLHQPLVTRFCSSLRKMTLRQISQRGFWSTFVHAYNPRSGVGRKRIILSF